MGFTIVELMISLAMVVILMVGIHQVFKMSSDTVGMGQAIADMSRSNRSVQGIFRGDYDRLVKNAPLFIIRSGVSSTSGAFTTEAERAADRDGDPLTQDMDGDGNEGQTNVNGEITPLSIYNSRNHRVDVIGFPANGLFHRHTANDGSYSSPLTSQDAFIFYEHVRLPTSGTYFDPGDPVPGNVANSLAGQWILGRIALLMRDPPMLLNNVPAPDNFIQRNNIPLSPLSYKSVASDPKGQLLTECRYDLLGASLETLRQDVADVRTNVISGGGSFDYPTSIWWQPLIYKQLPNSPPVNSAVARFECNPRIAKPITSEAMAKAMPVLLSNCSQFIVEYAGDFLTQDNTQFVFDNSTPPKLVPNPTWGDVTNNVPDNVIDYVVDHANYPNLAAKVRWYGLPRDTNGDRMIFGYAQAPSFPRALHATDLKGGSANYNGATKSNELVDVVPLWDVIQTLNPNLSPGTFEREFPFAPPGGDYVAGMLNAPANVKAAFRYTCVWANSAPKMIRIVLKLEDPAGRLPEGQWYEYVVGAP
jgi:type II secretory pathway pseudopilin PulG